MPQGVEKFGVGLDADQPAGRLDRGVIETLPPGAGHADGDAPLRGKHAEQADGALVLRPQRERRRGALGVFDDARYRFGVEAEGDERGLEVGVVLLSAARPMDGGGPQFFVRASKSSRR